MRVHLMAEGFSKHTGGVRRTSYELLAALRRRGAVVDVATGVDGGPPPPGRTPGLAHRVRGQAGELATVARAGTAPVHALYYDPAALLARRPVVVTVYDMAHEREGAGRGWAGELKRRVLRRADVVVAISAATADDVRAELPAVGPLVVSHLGVTGAFLERPRPVAPVRRHVLYVGRRQGYKNFGLLRDAMDADADLRELPLVVVGGPRLASVEQRRHGSLTRHDGVDDAALRDLYDSALALVVPSRREGFGLPVLEAMARSCPVACSATPGLIEVAAGHAALFDATSVDACAVAVRAAIDTTRTQLDAARDHAIGHTWDAAADRHIDVYRALAG